MTFLIQARLGDEFEDLYIKARTAEAAIAKARKLTRLQSRWTRFVA